MSSSPAFIHSSSVFATLAWLEVDNSETQYHGLDPGASTHGFVQWLETKGIHFLFRIASCYQKSAFVVLQMIIKCRHVYQIKQKFDFF